MVETAPEPDSVSIVLSVKAVLLDALIAKKIVEPKKSTPSAWWLVPAVVGGAVLAPLAVVGAVAALGFTAGGVAAGSAAAWMMSFWGGAVPAGGLIAMLQSIGAAGLGAAGIFAAAGTGAAAGAGIGEAARAISKVASSPEFHANKHQLDRFVEISVAEPVRSLRIQLLPEALSKSETTLLIYSSIIKTLPVLGSRLRELIFQKSRDGSDGTFDALFVKARAELSEVHVSRNADEVIYHIPRADSSCRADSTSRAASKQ